MALQKGSLHQWLEEVLAENAVLKDQVGYTDVVFCWCGILHECMLP